MRAPLRSTLVRSGALLQCLSGLGFVVALLPAAGLDRWSLDAPMRVASLLSPALWFVMLLGATLLAMAAGRRGATAPLAPAEPSAPALPVVLAALAIVVAFVALYRDVLTGGFFWDDHMGHIQPAREICSKLSPGSIWTRFFLRSGPVGFRSVPVFVSAFDYALWGLNPFGWHLTTMLFHVAAACVLMALMLRLRCSRSLAVLSGALFAFFPFAAEPIAYVTLREETVTIFLYLATLYLYTRSVEQPLDSARRGALYSQCCSSIRCWFVATLCGPESCGCCPSRRSSRSTSRHGSISWSGWRSTWRPAPATGATSTCAHVAI